ncbi:hypothetical protein LABOLPEG_00023 [Pseudomonas phage phi 21A]|nr:hypothetical protein LABOLPEG_00023 [Pseudomonas phage phi 21A]
MSITREQVIQALDLKVRLEALGFSVIIAGGFARDVYFMEPPKDLDIVVAGASMEDVRYALDTLDVIHVPFHVYNGASSDRLLGGCKCVGNVDVVVYDVRTAAEAPLHFDFNINQFVVLGSDFDTAYAVYAGETNWHDLEAVRTDFSQERRNKMHEKWLNLSWRYPEGEGPARVHLRDAVFHDPNL